MGIPGGKRRSTGAAFVAAAAMVLSSCGGGSPPPAGTPPVVDAPTVPGAIVVSGTERLTWNQAGDVSTLRFRAYVDGIAVALDTVRCEGAPEAECFAPLPPLTTGVHTVALSAVSGDLESPRSDAITVQKTATRSVVSAASFPDARVSSGAAMGLEAAVSISGGVTFAADVVARAMKAPLQLASTPDGRLFVGTADGLVYLVRPGEPDRTVTALDAKALLDPPPAGPLAVALHAEFARNQLVYVSFLAEDGPGQPLFRIVRLREAGDTLGEPATIFEAPVVVARDAQRTGDPEGVPGAALPLLDAGPRLSFGPDGLLYALLPPGLAFHHEPAASRPHASMVRIHDDGRMPEVGPLSGITAHPLGFAWHPATGGLWMIFPGDDGAAVVRPVTGGAAPGLEDPGHSVLRLTEGRASSSMAMAIEESPAGMLPWSSTFAVGIDHESAGVIRLLVPILAESLLTGISGRITDVVAAGGGTLFLAASSAKAPAGGAADSGDVVMRLRLR